MRRCEGSDRLRRWVLGLTWTPSCVEFQQRPSLQAGHTKARPTDYNKVFSPHDSILDTVPQTSIPIESSVRDRLKTFGHAGMNYSQIVTAVLDRIECEAFIAEMRRIASDPATKWVDDKDLEWD
jgi:hypothetical protein